MGKIHSLSLTHENSMYLTTPEYVGFGPCPWKSQESSKRP